MVYHADEHACAIKRRVEIGSCLYFVGSNVVTGLLEQRTELSRNLHDVDIIACSELLNLCRSERGRKDVVINSRHIESFSLEFFLQSFSVLRINKDGELFGLGGTDSAGFCRCGLFYEALQLSRHFATIAAEGCLRHY